MAQESWKCDKDETGCEPPEGPVLCANNCGFFGSMTTMNLCSKCYRDVVLSQAKVSSALDQMPLIGNTEASSTASLSLTDRQQQQQQHQQEQQQQQQQEGIAAAAAAAAESSSSAAEAMQSAGAAIRTANRCSQCNKRVGLTGFSCRCGNLYCNLHRYSDKHNCSYDYKSAGRDAISKANPVVKADKIDKI